MKKIKLLTPMLAIATLSTPIIPLTSCSQQTTSHIKYEGAKYFNIEHGETIDVNIVLDKVYTKDEITKIELVTSEDHFLSYTYDLNDKVLTLHITQVKTDMDDKEVSLDINISTSNWTDAIKGITFNYSFAHETGFRAYAFEKTTLTYKLANDTIDLWYSKDNKNWTQLIYLDTTQTLDIEQGESIWFKGKNENGLCPSGKASNATSLVFTNANVGREDKPSINLVGQLNALIYDGESNPDQTLPDNAFYGLFAKRHPSYDDEFLKEGSTGINVVTNNFLPSTKLSQSCYLSLFHGCNNLTNAPKLPAETLANNCYQSLFGYCYNILKAPELHATILKDNCYKSMFFYCKSLTECPELPATEMTEGCYYSMFRGCLNIVKSPKLPAKTLAKSCYSQMFYGTGLVEAPELPLTTLAPGCYADMFQDCTSLVTAPELPAKTLANDCYSGMLGWCTSLVNPPKLPATTLAPGCYSYMFQCCTSLATAPELPVENLEEYCYKSMFSGCTSLINAPELPAKELADYCYSFMFGDCTSLIEAPDLPALNLKTGCYSYMFMGCKSLTKAPILSYTSVDGAEECCFWMFTYCESLVKPPVLPYFETLPKYAYQNMFSGCKKLKIKAVDSAEAEGYFFKSPKGDIEDQAKWMFTETNEESKLRDTPVADTMYAWYE